MRSTIVQAALTAFFTLLVGVLSSAATAPRAAAQDPFYAGKRLTVLVNFAPGGATDAEARVFARHIGRLIDGEPSVIIQNMDGAGGLVGGKYLGEVAPRDGSMVGYFTATGFLYALDPERFKVDFKTYEFVGIQPGTSINFVRTDVAPGMKEPRDIGKAQNLIMGSLAPDSSKGVRMRLAFDILGVPYKYISGYRSGAAAKLAFERGEINFWGESPPSYSSIIEPALVKTGSAIPVYQDPGYDGQKIFQPESAKGFSVPQFQVLYRQIKGTDPSGRLWEIYKNVLAADGTMQRLILLPPGSPPAAVSALRQGLARLNKDKAHAEEAQKAFGYVPVWEVGTDNNAIAARAMTMQPEVRSFLADYIKNPPKISRGLRRFVVFRNGWVFIGRLRTCGRRAWNDGQDANWHVPARQYSSLVTDR